MNSKPIELLFPSLKLPSAKLPILAILTAVVMGCSYQSTEIYNSSWGEKKALLMSKLTGSSEWQRLWWIEKTARVLRGGQGLSPDENAEDYLRLSDEEIVDLFMKDSRFGDTLLDFNLFFLGFKQDQVRDDVTYVEFAFESANAILSAQETFRDGDFDKLFEYEGSHFIPPMRSAFALDHSPGSKPDRQRERERVYLEGESILRDMKDWADANPTAGGVATCQKLQESSQRIFNFATEFFSTFNEVVTLIQRASPFPTGLDPLAQLFFNRCFRGDDSQALADLLRQEMKATHSHYVQAFQEILSHQHHVYNPQTILEIKPTDLTKFRFSGPWVHFGLEQSVALGNSSTNLNRKRGAYVLKHFFCDDLKPVGFDNPDNPIPGKHGSDTSCYSCHYKLDPMAGFFRNLGVFFANFSESEFIQFDDGAQMNRQQYLENWKAPASLGREWNIGYVRSAKWTGQNMYGESLADLSRILKTAPEVRRCVVKRTFEYLHSESQTVDGGYLDYLAQEFQKESQGSSGRAFKNVMKRIVLGQTFRERSPVPDSCYDYPPGFDPSNKPPCRVNFLLQKNCKQCHGSTDGDGGLDLTRWVKSTSSDQFAFPHVNEWGDPIEPKETLALILDRLSTQDPKRRMPKDKFMDSQERQELYLWVNSELSR